MYCLLTGQARRRARMNITIICNVCLVCQQVKPDGVQRGLVGDIMGHLERKGFTLKGFKMFGVQSMNISNNVCLVC